MSYDFRLHKAAVVEKCTKKYGTRDDAIFVLDALVADLRMQIKGKDEMIHDMAKGNDPEYIPPKITK